MKKILLVISALVLVFTLSACKPEEVVEGVTSVTLSGFEDQTIMVDDVFNVLTGVVATGSDGVDYSNLITADSDNCTVESNGSLDTSVMAVCIINYAVVVEGKVDFKTATITIDKEDVIIDENAPLVKGWTFDDEADLVGWDIYVDGGGSVTSSIDSGALKLDVISSTNVYGSRFSFMGVPLQNGVDYVVKFSAKSSVAGKMVNLQIGELLPPPTYFLDFKPGQTEHITLTTEWAEYSYSFTMDIDNVNGGPLFEMGNVPDTSSIGIDAIIWIDDLEIRGGSSEDTVAPTLSGVENVIVYLGDAFDDAAGVAAFDFVDGDLTSSIVISGDTVDVNAAGVYTVTYTVIDAALNEKSVDRVVTVMADILAPEIFGAEDTVVPVGYDFNPLYGVTAVDNRDGDVTADIEVSGDTVDTAVAGTYVVTYTVEDALGNSFALNREVIVNAMIFDPTDLLINGTFDASSWSMWKADWNTTDAAMMVADGVLTVDIANVGAENWNIQIFQEGMNFVNGQQYQVSFDAMSTVARDINAKLIATTEFTQMFSLTTTMTTYTYTFTFTDADGTGKLDFELGGAQGGILVSVPSVVTFDNIMVEEFDGAAVVADTNQVINGDLSGGINWGVWMADWNSTSATVSFLDGAAVLDISDVGAENWNIQLFQEGISMVYGLTYTVQFDVMTTVDRDINLKLITGVEFAEMFSITTTMTTYTYTFVYTEADGLVKLDFELGGAQGGILVSVPSVVTIDNVIIFVNYN